MDEPLLSAEEETYRCPGEAYSINRAVHLARLTTFYPPCRECVCRVDARLLSPPAARHWAELERHAKRGAYFTAEGFEGSSSGDIDPPLAGRFVSALVRVLWHRHDDQRDPPAVLVGADGHWTTAELVAAACEALRMAGCRAIEAGAATSASLAAATCHTDTQAALWIGNSTGGQHAISLKLWGRSGKPWSAPGELDAVRTQFESSPAGRPQRRGGALERATGDERYLAPLKTLFHALRPLRFVLDTTCEPLVRQLGELGSQAACQVLRPIAQPNGRTLVSRSDPREARHREFAGDTLNRGDRLARLGQRVLAEAAHFGLWIDGDGESCRAVDERGVAIPGERLFLTLARYIGSQRPGATLAVERQASGALSRSLAGSNVRVVHSDATRQAMFETMLAQGAVFGGGPSGRFWFAGEPPAADALLALCLLLTMLSQSDRAVGEVLDAA